MKDNKELAGIFYTVSAFVIWGVLPLFWRLLIKINSLEITAHRIFWAFVFFTFFNFIKKRGNEIIRIVKAKEKLLLIFASSFLLGANWFLYVWAVNHDKVVEASMGYYINPIFSIVLGMIFLREKLKKIQILAFLLATTGVVIIIVGYGKIPWVALGLTLLFGFYGLTKKVSKVDSLISLNLETLFMLPLVFYILIAFRVRAMEIIPLNSFYYLLLLIIGGILTAIPIYFFSQGAKLIKLSYIGFFQYIAPSLNLVIGIFIFKESFTTIHFISFSFIWLSLILFIVSNIFPKKRIVGDTNVFIE